MSDDILKDFLDEARSRMQKAVEATRSEFSTVRTGRASPHLLDRIEVDYYGARTPLRQLAQVSATEARLLTITPYDKNSIKLIEKAILESDVGLTPSNDGQVIRLQIPELTEERRRELVKVLHGLAEQGRVGVRTVRRDVMHDLRDLKNEGEVGSDDEHRAEDALQKLTDTHVGEIDTALAGKEQEILEV
jgi:ribosome recycling factor